MHFKAHQKVHLVRYLGRKKHLTQHTNLRRPLVVVEFAELWCGVLGTLVTGCNGTTGWCVGEAINGDPPAGQRSSHFPENSGVPAITLGTYCLGNGKRRIYRYRGRTVASPGEWREIARGRIRAVFAVK